MKIRNVILPFLLSCCVFVTAAAQKERTDTLRPSVSVHPLSGSGQGMQSFAVKKRPRVAVVLSGGGAKGMAHIGVLKVPNTVRRIWTNGNDKILISSVRRLRCNGIPPRKAV